MQPALGSDRPAWRRGLLAAVASLCVGATVPGGATPFATHGAPRTEARPSGVGALCWWALVVTAADVGRRCPVPEDRTLQAALEESEAALDRHVMARSGIDATGVAAFKRRHASAGQGAAALCTPDAISLREALRTAGAAAVRRQTVAVTDQPGAPAWGDCL
jgi:hypothetical protein